MSAAIIRGDAFALPLADETVDLIVTSPPYFALRSYTDGGEHYAGQLGSEATPAAFLDALIAATREMVRVLKPSGSIFVNLGDSYSGKPGGPQGANGHRGDRSSADEPAKASRGERTRRASAQMTREDGAWLAGVIDSDGSIGIHVNQQPEGRAPSFVPWVRVGQMRPEVVHRIAEITGTGQVMQDGRGVWNWSASAQQGAWVLARIHPWLLIKRRQAFAAIEVARHVRDRNARGSWRPLTSADIAYRQRLKDAVNAWNQGTPDDLVPPAAPSVPLPIWADIAPEKSLRLVPELYRLRCVHELGLIAREVIVWSKPNGLPESVTDRCRRSHEDWVHLTKLPRYYSATDEIREPHTYPLTAAGMASRLKGAKNSIIHDDNRGSARGDVPMGDEAVSGATGSNPLGKLPGSVWTIATEPLTVPEHLGVDHFAAFPAEWPRRLILGWSPPGICIECGEGRRLIVDRERAVGMETSGPIWSRNGRHSNITGRQHLETSAHTITGEACACPEPTAPTRPAIILDPFGGTGTTALVAAALGRHGISLDMSGDYCRIAAWRTTDPGQRAKAMRVEKPPPAPEGMDSLFDLLEGTP